ncbi:MAG: DUF1566 domain-containing protein [Candidatus Magnetominusculus sp. LBB02]|nr:DUF1566 domain-containing protein [Candidatus Magnetominusculus sp. LBB02]
MTLKVYIIAAALCFILSHAAWADTVNLPQTGQTACWDADGNTVSCVGTGQDGDIRAGAAWSSQRFTDNGDKTMTDTLTGLMWTKDAGTSTIGSCSGGTMSWQNALNYVACLDNSTYHGYSDWRMPNVVELKSLINYNAASVAAWLQTQGFTNVHSDLYWLSTTNAYDNNYTWIISLDTGNMDDGNKSSHRFYVWPVRGGK